MPVSVGAGPQGLPGTPSGASTPAGASTGPSRLVGSVARVRRRRRWRARQTPAARRATVVESAKSDLRPRARGAVLGEATWLMASNLMASPHWQGESPCTRICVDRFESAPRRPFRPVVGMTIKPHSRDVDAPAEFGHSTHDVTASSHTYEGMATRLGAAYTRDRRPPHGLPQTHVPKAEMWSSSRFERLSAIPAPRFQPPGPRKASTRCA